MEKEIALCPDPELYREILERVRGGCRPAERPEALFLCGQPGCGKTSLAESLRDKGKAYIGGDDFREYHPDRDYIRERFPDYFAEITQPFVSACVRLLLRDLSKVRIPLIVEGTLRNPKVQVRTAEALLAEGYRADMVIPLASAECAWQRTLRRARDAEARGTCVRLVPLGKYNGTVLHLPSSLRQAPVRASLPRSPSPCPLCGALSRWGPAAPSACAPHVVHGRVPLASVARLIRPVCLPSPQIARTIP